MAGNPAHPWPAGASTGIGSLPGTDPVEAIGLVLGEVDGLPYLPELPARGLGADMIGRSCALLVDLPVEWRPHGWTVATRSGRDLGRAHDHLQRDLDALTERAQGVGVLKVQVAGPLTLGACLELPNLHKLLTDHGAFRHLAGALAEGVRVHLDDLRARLPGTELVLQVDEPGMIAVLAGQVPTPSGYGTVRALEPAVAQPALAGVLEVAADGCRVVHCCGSPVPFDLLVGAGCSAISVDAGLVTNSQLDVLGSFVEAGGSLWLGALPGTDSAISTASVRNRLQPIWNKLGFAPQMLAETVVPTPSCGLAGASMPYVRRAISMLNEVGSSLVEDPF